MVPICSVTKHQDEWQAAAHDDGITDAGVVVVAMVVISGGSRIQR